MTSAHSGAVRGDLIEIGTCNVAVGLLSYAMHCLTFVPVVGKIQKDCTMCIEDAIDPALGFSWLKSDVRSKRRYRVYAVMERLTAYRDVERSLRRESRSNGFRTLQQCESN